MTSGVDLNWRNYHRFSSTWTARGTITLTSESGGFIKLEDGTDTFGDGLAKLGLQGSGVAEEVTGTGVNVATAANAMQLSLQLMQLSKKLELSVPLLVPMRTDLTALSAI